MGIPPGGRGKDVESMSGKTKYFTALRGRESGREYPLDEVRYVCEFDFGPLEVKYDYDAIKADLSPSANRQVSHPSRRRTASRNVSASRVSFGLRTTRSTIRRCRLRTAW